MTTQQRTTIAHIEAQHEAERWEASQAAREVAELDEMSVIIAVQVKINEGRIEIARQMWLDYKRGK
jgi:hypothetical protein